MEMTRISNHHLVNCKIDLYVYPLTADYYLVVDENSFLLEQRDGVPESELKNPSYWLTTKKVQDQDCSLYHRDLLRCEDLPTLPTFPLQEQLIESGNTYRANILSNVQLVLQKRFFQRMCKDPELQDVDLLQTKHWFELLELGFSGWKFVSL